MRRSDSEAIHKAAEAFQRSVLALNPKRPEDRARAWPGTKHIEAAIDEYLEATVRESRVDKVVGVELPAGHGLPAPAMAKNADILAAIVWLRGYIEKVAAQTQVYRRAQLLTKLASNLFFDVADFQIRERFPE